MNTLARSLVCGFAAVLAAIAAAAPVHAQADGPEVTVDRSEVDPSGRVVLTIDGFEAGAVTISVCGNEANRGSADCNMVASRGLRLNRDGSPTTVAMPVAEPPVACPCVLRVSSPNNDEVAIVPIALTGHPVEPVVGSPELGQALAVSVSAEAASGNLLGRLRSSLGGPTAYDMTVTVRNGSTAALSRVAVTASVGRGGDDDLVTIEIPTVGRLGPGETWQHVVRVELPAPVLGGVTWRASASGAGPAAAAEQTTRHVPVLLFALTVVFAGDVVALASRQITRARRRKVTNVPSATGGEALAPAG